jgi:hypothetical protein
VEGANGGKKRRKLCLQAGIAMTNDDRGNGEKAGGSGAMRIMNMECSSKHQAQPPTNHFERLL